MKKEILLDLIIVNWNSSISVTKCIQSIDPKELQYINIIVVNNSEENLQFNLEDFEQSPTIIHNQKNLGFGGGCNVGALQGASPYILFLNPDIIFPKSSFSFLIEAIKRNDFPKDVGVIGVQLRNPDGSVQKNVARFPRFKDLFPRMVGLDKLLPRIFISHYDQRMDYSQSQIVDQVPGAFFLVRRKVFDSIGGFDEGFFMYYEDVDFSYRLQLAGWKTLYYPSMYVFHEGGGSTNKIKSLRLFYVLRSRIRYIKKHFGKTKALMMSIGLFIFELPSRIIKGVFNHSSEEIISTINAYAKLLKYLFKYPVFGRK